MFEEGTRVGAIQSANKEEGVNFYGYGTYDGNEVPPPGQFSVFGFDMNEQGIENPKITLDNGDVVWGCECWWGPEEEIKAKLEAWKEAGLDINTVPVPERNQTTEETDAN